MPQLLDEDISAISLFVKKPSSGEQHDYWAEKNLVIPLLEQITAAARWKTVKCVGAFLPLRHSAERKMWELLKSARMSRYSMDDYTELYLRTYYQRAASFCWKTITQVFPSRQSSSSFLFVLLKVQDRGDEWMGRKSWTQNELELHWRATEGG